MMVKITLYVEYFYHTNQHDKLLTLKSGTNNKMIQKIYEFNDNIKMNDIFVGKSLTEEELNELFKK